MKADKDTMRKYNELKEFDIINVKNTVGRKTVKLETILKNIQKSSNLKALRKAHEEEDKRKNEEREKDKNVRFGAPKTTIQTLESAGRGGGGPTKYTKYEVEMEEAAAAAMKDNKR
jgi:hypothetical protein